MTRKSYYKFLAVEGFCDIVEQGRLKFSNMNAWKNDLKNGDPFENYFSRCFEEKEAFDNFVKVCSDFGDDKGQILEKLGYLYILSYRTYALSLTRVSNRNCMAMWNGYAKEGVRIEFDETLIDYLEKQNKETLSMVADNVKYRAKMRTLRYVFGRELEKDFFKRAAFFEKVDAYAYEKEFRIVATKFGIANAFQMMFIPYAKEFVLEFGQLKQNIARYLLPYNIIGEDEEYLIGDYLPYIKSVQASPYIPKSKEQKVKRVCDQHGLYYRGVSQIRNFRFEI